MTQNEIDRLNYIGYKMRGGNWEEVQENRKWENRNGWRVFYNSRLWKRLKNDYCYLKLIWKLLTWHERRNLSPPCPVSIITTGTGHSYNGTTV